MFEREYISSYNLEVFGPLMLWNFIKVTSSSQPFFMYPWILILLLHFALSKTSCLIHLPITIRKNMSRLYSLCSTFSIIYLTLSYQFKSTYGLLVIYCNRSITFIQLFKLSSINTPKYKTLFSSAANSVSYLQNILQILLLYSQL